MGVDMKQALLFLLTVFLLTSSLSALGYSSAFVEAKETAEREDEYITKGLPSGSGFGTAPAAQALPPTYYNASNMQLAMPANPLTDTTSKLVYGLMDIILMRFKQQLFISSVSQWRDELLLSEIRYFFPNLTRMMNTADPNNFLASYDLWRSAIEKDLIESPMGILNFAMNVLDDNPNLTAEEKSLLAELKNLMNDIYSFRNVSNLHEFILVATTEEGQHSQFFRLIGVIAKNMLDESGDIVIEELTEFTKNPKKLAYYLEAIKDDVDDFVINDASFQVTKQNFQYYLDSCDTVETFFSDLETRSRTPEHSVSNQTDFLKLYLATCDKLLVQWSSLSNYQENNWDKYYNLFTKYRFKLVDVAEQVDARDYKGLLNTMITTSISIAEEHNYIPVSYSRFLNLISTLALTGDAREINYREVMNSILEPVGSYSYKRKSDFTVALNTYPGLGGGAETLKSDMKDAKAVAGLACPVGLELNWGKGFLGLRGVFLSALDLGAVATYRFDKDVSDDSNSPQIGLKQLVSPGLYLLLQREKDPITLGLGVQMTPELRKVTDDGTDKDKNALRVGAFVSMDIPLFTFYVKHDWQKTE